MAQILWIFSIALLEMIQTTLLLTVAVMTWYGPGFVGECHAACWYGETPECSPETVTYDFPGVAASTDFQFGTVLKFTRLDTGGIAYGIVLDRMRDYTDEERFDAWPFLADLLGFGPGFGFNDVGVIEVRVEVVNEEAVDNRGVGSSTHEKWKTRFLPNLQKR